MDAVDCGEYSCSAGTKCGSGKQCLAADAVDCGKGISCAAGYVCRKEGGCATPEQLAAEAEVKKKAEREREIEQKRISDQNANFLKIMNDPKQPMVSRKLAAAILGKELPNKPIDKTESDVIASALKKNIRTPTTTTLSDEYLLNVMNDQRQAVSTRRIAALALGRDPYSVRPQTSAGKQVPQSDSTNLARNPGVILNPNVIKDIATLTASPPKTEPPQPPSFIREQFRLCSTFNSNDPMLDKYGCPKTSVTPPAQTPTKPNNDKKDDSNPFTRQPTPEELAAEREAQIKADPLRLERVPKKIEEVTKCPTLLDGFKHPLEVAKKRQIYCTRDDGTTGPGWICDVCNVVTSCSVKNPRDCIEEESSCKTVCKAERVNQRIETR